MSAEEFEDALESRDMDWIRRLVEEDEVDVNSVLTGKMRALHIASMYGNSELVQLLLENNADVNVMDRLDQTPLHVAFILHGANPRVLQLLIDHKADIHARDEDGKTALCFALNENPDSSIIRFLLENNADPNAVDREGYTPLHDALRHNCDLEVVQCLLECGADGTARSKFGSTLLHHALRHHASFEVVQCLVNKSEIDVSARNKCGSTALHHALQYGSDIEVVQYLLDRKADVNARTNCGITALHHAIQNGADLAVVRLLIDSKADVKTSNTCGDALLHAIANDKDKVIPCVMELLLSHGADAHAKNHRLETPLHSMANLNCVAVATVLLNHLRSNKNGGGQDMLQSALLAVDQSKHMPFHHVKNVEMARLLLEQPLTADDQLLVPRACPLMLFAKDRLGRSLLDLHHNAGPLHDYLASYTKLPLTVPATATCEHRQKRRRYDVAVRLNPMLNEFQSSIAEAFLHKWDGWSTLFIQKEDNGTADAVEDDYYVLPVELKRAVMAYLTTADAMMIRATSSS